MLPTEEKTAALRTYRFRVFKIPLKRRPRTLRSGHTYTDPLTVQDERRVKAVFEAAYPQHLEPRKGAFQVYLWIRAEPSKTPRRWPKLDVDNVAKAVLDALNRVLWEDDDQVIGLCIFKSFCGPEEVAYVQVECREF